MLENSKPLVRDFMGRGVITVPLDSSVARAVLAMEQHGIGSVVVVDSLGPYGVFTERHLLSRVLAKGKDPESTLISEVASPKFPSIEATLTLEETAKAMITKKSRLMVLEGGTLVGIVTPTDMVNVLKDLDGDFSILKVVSTRVVTVSPETSVHEAVNLMDRRRVGSVLVVEGGRWSGIFTERDLVRRVLVKRKSFDAKVEEVATRPLVTSEPGIFGREAAGEMSSHRFKRLPITHEGEGIGIVTARDLVEAYANERPLAPRIDWVQWN